MCTGPLPASRTKTRPIDLNRILLEGTEAVAPTTVPLQSEHNVPGHSDIKHIELKNGSGLEILDTPLPIGVNNVSTQYTTDFALVLAYTVLAMVPALIFYLIAERQIVGGLTAGALKE